MTDMWPNTWESVRLVTTRRKETKTGADNGEESEGAKDGITDRRNETQKKSLLNGERGQGCKICSEAKAGS